jgi:hypothetical protein
MTMSQKLNFVKTKAYDKVYLLVGLDNLISKISGIFTHSA